MSLSSTLSNALSGLTVASRKAELVSSNVANASTDGYGRRVMETTAASIGGRGAGVEIVGVSRIVDAQVLEDRRLAGADLAASQTNLTFWTNLELAIGDVESEYGLSGRLNSFETALVEAASRPDSDVRLQNVLDSATALSDALNSVSDEIQTRRSQADADIASQVNLLNSRLVQIADLNHSIRVAQGNGQDALALMDQRQTLVDDVSEIVPIRIVQGEQGDISLFTATGATLVSGGHTAEFGFAATGTIVPEMSVGSGALSGLSLNGEPIDSLGPHSRVAGGSLAALFEVRDITSVDAQSELDAVARNLIARFEGGIDPTLASGDAGLFTDSGAVLDPSLEVGLAGRIAINHLVVPESGGDLWRLRSGLGATSPGDSGDSTLFQAYASALNDPQTADSGRFSTISRSFSGMLSEFGAYVSQNRVTAEDTTAFAASRHDTLQLAELAQGVDTDQELQNLLLIEQAYAANAKVVEIVDQMIESLMRI